MKDKDRIISNIMAKKGLVSQANIKDALEKQQLSGRPLDQILIELGYTTAEKIAIALSEELGIPYVDLDSYNIDKDAIKLFPESLIRELNVIPLFKIENSITVAMEDPLDIRTVDKLRYISKRQIDPMLATKAALTNTINKVFGPKGVSKSIIDNIRLQQDAPKPASERPMSMTMRRQGTRKGMRMTTGGPETASAKEGPIEALSAAEKRTVVNTVDNVIKQAASNKASDIHIEPEGDKVYLRFRIDGLLYDVPPPPKELEAAIISRIKILSGMDIAERRMPQDGRIQTIIGDKEVDLRVSTFPTIYGENISIRVLDKSTVLMNLSELGFNSEMLETFKDIITRPYGIILATGPTGCGKTTSLYSVLREINRTDKNIITLEDPVEYRIPRVRQSQIDMKAGLTFAMGLRSIVRQDPDVILIGEIRDLETAEIAIRSALTGHLVLSTLHTNDAASAVTRLIDMGIEPFLVSSSIVGVLAQRLVRVLCEKCKKSYKPSKELLKALNLPTDKSYKFYSVGGCDECRKTGYTGRIGVFELMVVSDAIKEMVLKEGSASRIKEKAMQEKMITLRIDGIKKVVAGSTTVEEIFRTTEKDIV